MSTIREHVDIPLAEGFPFPTPAWKASADQFYHRLYITRDDSWADWKTRPVVIFFHGSGEGVAPQGENSWFVRQILAKGYVWIDSMALDAQGSCGIRPWKYPYGSLAALNLNLSGINLAWWVRSTMESTLVKGLSNKVVLMGHSMGGGAIMPYLAGRTGARSNQIVGSIVNSHMTAADGRGGFHDGTRTLRYNNALLAEIDSKLLVVAGGADSYCPPAYMRRLQVSLKTTSPVYVMVGHRTGDHGWWTSSARGQKMVQWCQQLIEGTGITDINGNPAQAGPVAPAPPLPPPPAVTPPSAGVLSFKTRTGHVVPVAGDYAVADITGLTAALAGKASATHSHGISDVSGLAQALAERALVSHAHTVAQVVGLQAALDGKAAVGASYTKAQSDSALAAKQDKLDFVAGQTSTFLAKDGQWRTPEGGGGGTAGVASFNGRADDVLPEAGDYNVSQITGLQAALDGKAGTTHSHTTAQITGLDDALAGKLDKPVDGDATKWLTGTGDPSALTFNASVQEAIRDPNVKLFWAAADEADGELFQSISFTLPRIVGRLNYDVKRIRALRTTSSISTAKAGTMCFGILARSTTLAFGATVKLSSTVTLTPSDAAGGVRSTGDMFVEGTWRCLGFHAGGAEGARVPTLWLRTE